ncbi:MAG: protein kinase [Pseudomonadota bacterium]
MKTTGIFTGQIVPTEETGTENCLPIGTRLADFEITGILGEGGFGIVYVAFDHSLQRTVAIKEYMPGALAGRGADQSVTVRSDRHRETFRVGLNSFINEARFLAQFDHPSLVKVYRYWEQNQTAYMAMRYYNGRTVKDIVNNNPEVVTHAWCKSIVVQILEALEMLYTMKILHRDVSPDNIIVQENGDAVLLDFGSARQIIGDLTRGLTVILKPGYAPIEQYAGDASLEQGAWTDIYALSAVIFFAITKEPPATSIARIIKDPLLPLSGRGLNMFSIRFLAAIDKGLAVQAQDRPRTIAEFREMMGIRPPGTQRLPNPAQRVAAPHAQTGKNGKNGKSGGSRTANKTAVVKTARAKPSDAPASGGRRGLAAAAVLAVAALGVGSYAYFGTGGKPADPVLNAIPAPAAGAPTKQGGAAPGAPSTTAAASTPDGVAPANASATSAPTATDAGAHGAPAIAASNNAPAKPGAAPLVAAGAASPSASLTAAAIPALDPAAEFQANYKLLIKPWGTVYVDGKEKGVSPPLKHLTLPSGKHKIRIVNPNFPDYFSDIDTGKKKNGTIEVDLSASAKKTN